MAYVKGLALNRARSQMGKPYVLSYNGRAGCQLRPRANYDCSNFIVWAFFPWLGSGYGGYSFVPDSPGQLWRASFKPPGETRPKPGDVFYFPGHCGFVLNENTVLHAAQGYGVIITPLQTVINLSHGYRGWKRLRGSMLVK